MEDRAVRVRLNSLWNHVTHQDHIFRFCLLPLFSPQNSIKPSHFNSGAAPEIQRCTQRRARDSTSLDVLRTVPALLANTRET